MLERCRGDEEVSQPTVLFVDDEPLSLKYFKASVGPYANVLTAESAAAARKILAREGKAISVIVSDERMPQEGGTSFLCEARKSCPSAVLVLTSAYADFECLQRAINSAQIFRFVPKPWNVDELSAAVRGAIDAERNETSKLQDRQASPPFAEEASVELMAVLARELDAPLHAIGDRSMTIAAMATMRDILPPPE